MHAVDWIGSYARTHSPHTSNFEMYTQVRTPLPSPERGPGSRSLVR